MNEIMVSKTTMDKMQIYLFNEGTYYKSYEILGSHLAMMGEDAGFSFVVWAPHAKAVSVVGGFNNWDTHKNPMQRIKNSDGVWFCFIKGLGEGELYKYAILSRGDELIYKADPYAFFAETPPGTASKTYDLSGYRWGDKKYKPNPCYDRPMAIYELHLGSWQRTEEGAFLTYGQIADKLIDYLSKTHYTHVELMPLAEHPYDGSWGYQDTGFFAATSRYGEPKELMAFVDKLHQAGIGVIMDWVPAHFPRDAHGLRQFDGAPLYEYADPKKGEHKEWGTMVFDYGRPQVSSFLISNALFWLREFHMDGLRVDAVSSMLYLDYGRAEGQWVPNEAGGRENFEAVRFLQNLNKAVFAEFPAALMIAEESTSWPMVTKPTDAGGLGFNYKWNMGWMNDILRYFSLDPYFRKNAHNLITFSFMYAFSENFILPLSHDEVVHGKLSLINKMPGEYEQKFANLRAMFGYMYAHPGKKLMFMGDEFAQFIEWNYARGLDWLLLDFPSHQAFLTYICDLNEFYRAQKPLWQIDGSWDGFSWINAGDEERSIISFLRKGKRAGDELVVVANFTPVLYKKYVVGVPKKGVYEEIFSSDAKKYGGTGVKNREKQSVKKPVGEAAYSMEITVPPLGVLFFRKKAAAKKFAEKTIEAKKPVAQNRGNAKNIDKK